MSDDLPSCLTAALGMGVFPEPLYLAIFIDELVCIQMHDPPSAWKEKHPEHPKMKLYGKMRRSVYSARENADADLWLRKHVCINPRARRRMV